MLDRLAFRHTLAGAQVLLFFALLIWCELQARPQPHEIGAGDVQWDIRSDGDAFGPTECEACVAINAPAFVVLGWTRVFFPERYKWLCFVLVAPGVWVLWFFVGLWSDRRVGALVPRSRPRATTSDWVVASFGLTVLTSILGLGMFYLLVSWTAQSLIVIGVVGWSAFGAYLIISRMRLWRGASRISN